MFFIVLYECKALGSALKPKEVRIWTQVRQLETPALVNPALNVLFVKQTDGCGGCTGGWSVQLLEVNL